MSNKRIIARLDVKGSNLIKGVHLEGLRKVGDPQVHARRYYEQGIDEIIYMDVVASLYGRNNLTDIVRHSVEDVFIPITVGGGVRTEESALELLSAGADKIAINTAAIARPEIITELAQKFGSQCVVLSIEAKRLDDGRWEAFADNGRERTGRDVEEWAIQACELGAGEILLTSVDQEGTRKGFDIELTRRVSQSVPIPVIASGGLGSVDHFQDVIRQGQADAVAIADAFHFNRLTPREIRDGALEANISVRHLGNDANDE